MRRAWNARAWKARRSLSPRTAGRSRRNAAVGASAAALCLGGLLAACGDGGGKGGYVAVGAATDAAPDAGRPGDAEPTGKVEMVPLDEDGNGADDGAGDGGSGTERGGSGSGGADGSKGAAPGGGGSSDSGAPATPGSPPPAGGSGTPDGTDGTDGSGGASASPDGGGGTDEPSPGTSPAGPALLKVGDPERKEMDDRWCEKVTVSFRNSGGEPVRSGTVTFGTHVIGSLGVDWATVESTRKLPAPLAAGEKKEKSWTVCVDAWRVPLGMHIETQDVSVDWK